MLKKTLIEFITIILLVTGITWAGYGWWRASYLDSLESESEIANTALGDLEYRFFGGSGPVALFAHGTPGGYDQYVPVPGDGFEGFRVLVPSRPGYLRTELTIGKTVEQQADVYAALLDYLGIQKAIVVGSSGGAPSAITFAAKYPDKTLALVGLMPLSQPEPAELSDQGDAGLVSRVMQSDFMRWMMLEMFMSDEHLAERLFSGASESQVLGSPPMLKRVRMLARATWPGSLRRTGVKNDEKNKASLDALPLGRISAPTLIVHGTEDSNVDYRQSVNLTKAIEGAELFTIEGGNHFVLISHKAQIAERLHGFWAANEILF